MLQLTVYASIENVALGWVVLEIMLR